MPAINHHCPGMWRGCPIAAALRRLRVVVASSLGTQPGLGPKHSAAPPHGRAAQRRHMRDVACMADIRIAADTAKMGVTFLKLGLIPGDGGAWLLPRLIGASRAAELLFTGDVIDAKTAAEWGLVSRVVPADRLMDEAMALANRIAQQPPQALRLAKTLMRHGTTSSYDTIMEMSAAAQALMHETNDHVEGVNAILEKRAPVFNGN